MDSVLESKKSLEATNLNNVLLKNLSKPLKTNCIDKFPENTS